MFVEKTMDVFEVVKSKQLLDLIFRQPVCPVAFKRKGFQHNPGRIAVSAGEGAGDGIGNFHRDGHEDPFWQGYLLHPSGEWDGCQVSCDKGRYHR